MDQLGDYTNAVANLRAALEIDSHRPVTLLELGDISLFSRRYPEAIRLADSALALDPTFYHVYEHRAQMHSHFGQHREARATVDSVLTFTQGTSGHPISSLVAARAGDSVLARNHIERALGRTSANEGLGVEDRFWIAGARVALGDVEGALQAIEGDRLRGIRLWFRLQSPDFDPVRSHPRFLRLIDESRPRTTGAANDGVR